MRKWERWGAKLEPIGTRSHSSTKFNGAEAGVDVIRKIVGTNSAP